MYFFDCDLCGFLWEIRLELVPVVEIGEIRCST